MEVMPLRNPCRKDTPRLEKIAGSSAIKMTITSALVRSGERATVPFFRACCLRRPVASSVRSCALSSAMALSLGSHYPEQRIRGGLDSAEDRGGGRREGHAKAKHA